MVFSEMMEGRNLERSMQKPPIFANDFQCLANMLKNTKHHFVFIITRNQWPTWQRYCARFGYDKYTHFEMPYFVSNPNYIDPNSYPEPRRLRLVVLKGVGKDEN
jgi:hypothetical protein